VEKTSLQELLVEEKPSEKAVKAAEERLFVEEYYS